MPPLGQTLTCPGGLLCRARPGGAPAWFLGSPELGVEGGLGAVVAPAETRSLKYDCGGGVDFVGVLLVGSCGEEELKELWIRMFTA